MFPKQKALYPNAKILSLTDSDRDRDGRLRFYSNIKYNDWDMVVIPQSTFDMIPDSPERLETFIREKIDEKLHTIEALRDSGEDKRTVSRYEKNWKIFMVNWQEDQRRRQRVKKKKRQQ